MRVFGPADLPEGAQHEATKVLVDFDGFGIAGYAIDGWLAEIHRVTVGLSDGRHLLAIVSPGTSARDVLAKVSGLADCAKRLEAGCWRTRRSVRYRQSRPSM